MFICVHLWTNFFEMPESFATKIDRWKFNFFPAYRGTGARVIYISDDYREMRVKIPLVGAREIMSGRSTAAVCMPELIRSIC